MAMAGRDRVLKPLLLRVWRDVPFADWQRRIFLRILNPSFMIGAMALIQDEQGRILVVEHTYRRSMPWGMPGGWMKRSESPEAGLARELFEETGLRVHVDQLLAADFFDRSTLDLLYRCHVVAGEYQPSDETRAARWVSPAELPELQPNQIFLLRKIGLLPAV